MPNIYVVKEALFEFVGKEFSDEEFEDLCFQFGMEVEFTTTKEMPHRDINDEEEEKPVFKIEVAANRYDLLCVEGIGKAIKCFLGLEDPLKLQIKNQKQPLEKITVLPNTAKIRPFIVSAILRNITFTKQNYNSFISLQDKLHQNICRKRTLVAIGTHDYDTLQGPFTYEALPPNEIKFKALNQEQELTAIELMELYEKDMKLKEYLPIIRDSSVYPVIYDSNRVVLSMPPIINGNHSKINLNTKNVLIECTATDLTKAKIVLNIIIAMFSQYCESESKFSVEEVEVYHGEEKSIFPVIAPWELEANIDYVKSVTGLSDLTSDMAVNLLKKMGIVSQKKDNANILVQVPPERADILHSCDIAEDIAIAYGVNNITLEPPQVLTTGKQLPINKFSKSIRHLLAECGYNECLTLSLLSIEDHFKNLRQEYKEEITIKLANPKTLEYQTVRTSLIPGIMKCAKSNKAADMPVKLFEVSDVAFIQKDSETGAKNQRRLCAAYFNTTSGFEMIHGLLDTIMLKIGIDFGKDGYWIRNFNSPTFVEGRQAEIMYKETSIGMMGIIHPEVLGNYSLMFPGSLLELNIEYLMGEFLKIQKKE